MESSRETSFDSLTQQLKACRLCAGHMPNDPNPIFQLDPRARVLIASQAPGNLAHQSGKPFNDPSGIRLRDWMGISEADFYDPCRVAIMPMGFCFPGYDKHGGDLPPMKRCASTWRETLLSRLPRIQVSLLIGGYSQKWHLPDVRQGSLTDRVKKWRDHAPAVFLTPHPSWRNNAWLKKNPWFETEVLPEMRVAIQAALQA